MVKTSSEEDRYELENAANRINGYYLPSAHELAQGKTEQAFERAKAEALHHMRNALATTEAMSLDQFRRYRR